MEGRTALHWDVLDRREKELLPKLRFLKMFGFYLAGGTAIALQIKHRRSVDFDFYLQGKFDVDKIYQMFQKQGHKKFLLSNISNNTLIISINNVRVSIFTYDYPLLKPLIVSKYLNIASLEDIAAMKMVAIIQRGIKRDFIDFFFLCKIFGLEKIMDLSQKKYFNFNKYLACQSLVYFKDAEKQQMEKIKLFKPIKWEEIKRYFESEVTKLKKKLTA